MKIPHKFPKITRQELRRRRHDAGWSQPQFAELLGVTELTISHWENGHTPISRPMQIASWAVFHHATEEKFDTPVVGTKK